MKNWGLLAGVLTLALVPRGDAADTSIESRTEVGAALKGRGDAANAHDVERHVGYYAHTRGVTLIVDGEAFVGWVTIRDKQKEWWNQGKTDVVYQPQGPPDFQELAPGVMVSTLLMTARRTLPSGEVKEGRFAVSSIWRKLPEGWKIVYSHESTTR